MDHAGGPGEEDAPRVVRALAHVALLTPVRLALGGLGLLGAVLAGARPAVGAAAFALGAVGAAISLVADRRFTRQGLMVPEPLPATARRATAWETIVAGLFPSTFGVSLLTLVALFFNPALAALLAGIVAGMGLAGIPSGFFLDQLEREYRARYYVERGPGGRSFTTAR